MIITMWSLERIIRYARNARKIPVAAVDDEQLTVSI
jgi:hypothetical protein